jgi:uncharacterized membrane protein YeaQ/YmgE (transglycosylase-associated protein family)
MRTLPVIVAVAALSSACAIHQQRPNDPRMSDWTAVMALSADELIVATTRDGRRLSGKLQSVDAQQIVLGPVAVTLRREDVLGIWVIGLEDSLFKGYFLGAIVGLVLGSTIDVKDSTAVIMPVITAGVGAVLGAWIDRGWNGSHRKLVYRAARNEPTTSIPSGVVNAWPLRPGSRRPRDRLSIG